MIMLQRIPVPLSIGITQRYGVNATQGVIGKQFGTIVEQLVWSYGNYQPWGHDGDDWGCPVGTLVYPAGPGRIVYAGLGEHMPKDIADQWGFIYGPNGWASGNVVLADHSVPGQPPLGTLYAHGLEVLARTGQMVGIYDPIMRSGGQPGVVGSGRSGGPHLHASAVLLDQVYTAANYGRISILDRIPAGTSVPLAPGNTGAPATESDELIPGISELPK